MNMHQILMMMQTIELIRRTGSLAALCLGILASGQNTAWAQQPTGYEHAPFLDSPIKFAQPDENSIAPAKPAKKDAVPTSPDQSSAKTEEVFIDLAYGAYQRGYYLSAFKLALPRAESGDPAAQTLLAELYDKGQGIALDRKKAVIWYRFAANAGNREARFAYANILAKGKLVPLDKKAAQKFMKLAADAGHDKAQFNLAQMIVTNRPSRSGFEKALPYYRDAAESGLADAQYVLARIYATGNGVPHADIVRARKWMTLAALGGFDPAQLELAIWLAIGKGGTKDEKAALSWFILAAEQGNIIAQNRLARMYAFGLGTKQDSITASKWHILARRAGKNDLKLDAIFRTLSAKQQKQAISAANTWRTR
jgi:TPR repeat protein